MFTHVNPLLRACAVLCWSALCCAVLLHCAVCLLQPSIPVVQIGISESLIRHTRRISTDQHHAPQPLDRRMAAMQLQQRDRDQDLSDPNTKLQLIDTMLSSSPPLPAPPPMQQAQIQAQERELMMQMQMHHHAQAAAAASSNVHAHASAVVAPRTHRPSISAGIKPLVIKGAPLPPPPATAAAPASSALAAQLKPRLAQQAAHAPPPPISSAAATAAAAAAAASNDLFAKVEVPSRGKGGAGAGDAASFQPSSLAAALCDSGMLFGRERHAPVRQQHHRGGSNNHGDNSRGGQNGSKAGDTCTLTIYLHPYSDTAVRPCRVLLQLPPDTPSSGASSAASDSNPTTDELLASLLAKWSAGELARNFGLRAALAPEAADKSAWALHMVDEDTIDSDDECDDDEDGGADDAGGAGPERAMAAGAERGMPEEDLPPLERNRPVKSMGATTLAMVVAAGRQHRMPKHAAPTTLSPSAAAAATASASTASASAATAASSTSSSSAAAAASSSSSSGLASPARSGGPTSPTAAASPSHGSPAPGPNTHATQPLPPQLRRYDSARAAAPSVASSALSPGAHAQPKYRTVSVFSGSGAGVGAGAGLSARSSSQQAMSSDPSRHSVMLGHGGLGGTGAGAGGGGGILGEKFYLKIHIGDHESHIIGLYKTQLLSEVLPVLTKKKQAIVAMKSEMYRFLYLDPLLRASNDALRDMGRVRIGELASDELLLVPRLGGVGGTGVGGTGAGVGSNIGGGALQEREMRSQTFSSTFSHHHHHHHGLGGAGAGNAAGDDSSLGLGTSVAGGGGGALLSPSSDAPSLSSFQFSLDTASAYCEYRVIKTNQRGKRQPRIFGMDRHRIYNKTQSGGDEADPGASGVFSFIQRRIGTEPGVSRATRDINTIASVHVVSLRPTCFCIAFKESAARDSKVAQTREYELETKMECAEIVAKLRFLISHAVMPPNADAAVAASMAGSSMLLGQSTK